MSLPTFRKGAHPPHRKSATEAKPIETLLPKGNLVYPMSQHIGAPCKPTVKKGERVLAGQKIGDSEAFFSAPIIASVSGTVKDIALRETASGSMDMCVVIENDNMYEVLEQTPRQDYLNLPVDDYLKIIREAGIVGMGGACFATAVKLSVPPDKKIKHVIINGSECEPYLTCDHRLMLEKPSEILAGLRIAMKIFPEATGYIGIEDNKPDAIAVMKEVCAEFPNIAIVPVRSKYPQGAEKMLIYALTGLEVPIGGLPADVGCVMLNTFTAQQIYNAVALGGRVTERIVTVTGDAIAEPKNLLVKLGTSVAELIEACGGFKEEPAKVIAGGPLMGTSVSTLDIPVVKGTSGILALTENAAKMGRTQPCIRCGNCVEACPMSLLPYALDVLIARREYEAFEEKGGMNCIECGCCTYQCPSKRFLTQGCRDGKRTVLSRRRKAA